MWLLGCCRWFICGCFVFCMIVRWLLMCWELLLCGCLATEGGIYVVVRMFWMFAMVYVWLQGCSAWLLGGC